MMPDLLVTDHAVQRFQERVRPCTDQEARTALATPAVHAAALFGAQFVRLATGHRIALKGHVVMTVLPPEHFKRQVFRQGFPVLPTNRTSRGSAMPDIARAIQALTYDEIGGGPK